jgi:hypothetical protein
MSRWVLGERLEARLVVEDRRARAFVDSTACRNDSAMSRQLGRTGDDRRAAAEERGRERLDVARRRSSFRSAGARTSCSSSRPAHGLHIAARESRTAACPSRRRCRSAAARPHPCDRRARSTRRLRAAQARAPSAHSRLAELLGRPRRDELEHDPGRGLLERAGGSPRARAARRARSTPSRSARGSRYSRPVRADPCPPAVVRAASRGSADSRRAAASRRACRRAARPPDRLPGTLATTVGQADGLE